MTIEDNFKKQTSQLESSLEKEKFKPKIIFDFIRHGQAEYGQKVSEKMSNLGYKFEEHLPTSRISKEKMKERETWEGRVTSEGQEQLEKAVSEFVEKINMDKEVLVMLFGPRFRQEHSGEIILDELEKHGVNVSKIREHKDLIDFKKHWISVLEFANNKTKDGESPWEYWSKMSKEELKDADLEGFDDIKKRMEHFMELIKRYARRYQKQLGLDNKILRVISPTSDVNILSVLKKKELSASEQGIVKNAKIIELGVDEKDETKLMLGD